ncbi:MAG: hypothetical protein ACYS9T_03540 [Planctomycetota bacterium]|jgi:hypothetical protein
MDYQDFLMMGHKARRETEDFINDYIHDQEKRWPVICRSARLSKDSVHVGPYGMCSNTYTPAALPYQSLKHCKAG